MAGCYSACRLRPLPVALWELSIFSGFNQQRVVVAGFLRFEPVLKRLSVVNAAVKTIGVRFGNHVIVIAAGVHETVHQDSIDLTVFERFIAPGQYPVRPGAMQAANDRASACFQRSANGVTVQIQSNDGIIKRHHGDKCADIDFACRQIRANASGVGDGDICAGISQQPAADNDLSEFRLLSGVNVIGLVSLF